MTSPVVTVGVTSTLEAASQLLVRQGVSAAPVVDEDGRLVGVVTVWQVHPILSRLEADLRPGRAPFRLRRRGRAATVGDVMTSPIASLTPGADIEQLAHLFEDRTMDTILVVDGFSVVGVVSRSAFHRGSTT